MSRNALLTRAQIPAQLTWDLTDVYPDLTAWKADFERAATYPERFAAYKGRLAESGAVLLAALQLDEELDQLFERVSFYAERLYHQDTNDSAMKALTSRVSTLADSLSAAAAFMKPELLQIDKAQLEQFMVETPGLELYRHFFDKMHRDDAHVLLPEVEMVLSDFGSVIHGAHNIAETLSNADLPGTFPRVPQPGGGLLKLNESQLGRLTTASNRKIRRTGWQAVTRGFGNFGQTYAAIYSHRVVADVKLARTRKFGSAVEMYLERSYLPLSVYDSLVTAVRENLHLVHRYLRLKKRYLGLERMHIYDMKAPFIKAGAEAACTYEQAQSDILQAVALLGPDYVESLAECYRRRHVDVMPNKGKVGGAYNSGLYGMRPYMLINWDGTRRDRSTLAHESGHEENEWRCNAQPYRYYHYTIFNAEVASTMNELLLTRHDLALAKTAQERVHILQSDLDNFLGTIVRQTLFAEFEREAHALVEAGDPLTRDALCAIHLRLNQEYYRPTVFVDKLIENEWARIPHFYNSFYVFSYATALSAAICILNRMLREGQPAIDNYLTFLAAGCKDYPLNLLREGGADLTTSAPVFEAFAFFKGRLDMLEHELAQLG